MVVDYTSDIKLPGDTPDEPAKEPVPILWIFDSYGRLTGFHCVIAGETEKSTLMTTPIEIPQYTGGIVYHIYMYYICINNYLIFF